MTTWYARPDTTHNTTRDGTSYATAWGGLSEIVWGGVGVVAGDTLYICGAHTNATVYSLGNHGATVSSRVTIRGDYATSAGSITNTGTNYFNINRSYTTCLNLTFSAGTGSCIIITGVPSTGVTIQGCTFNAVDVAVKMQAQNTWSYVDVTITGNTFTGGSTGTGGSAIQWYVTSAITSSLNRVTITDNVFSGCSAARGTIVLRSVDTALSGTNMADIVISGNTFSDCGGVAMEVAGPGVYGRNTGIRIYDNVIYRQFLVGGIGGGIVMSGFGQSLTAGFGASEVYNNEAYELAGPTGFCNPIYGTYLIHDNYAEDITTATIDGCGILFDHGCVDCVAYANTFRRIVGGATDFTTGFGILVLDATTCTAYGNTVDGCLIGIGYGNKGVGQSSNFFNNHFLNCSLAGLSGNASAELTNNAVRNNLLTAVDSTVPSVRYLSGTWTGESYNCFQGFGTPTQTLHASDISADPLIASDMRPKAGSPLIAAGVYIQYSKGNDNKTFQNPPSIGAFEYVRPRNPRV